MGAELGVEAIDITADVDPLGQGGDDVAAQVEPRLPTIASLL